jgi:alcohol dehydrogenase (NADP+)
METKNAKAYGTNAAEAPLGSMTIQRREATPHDVEIEILFCGVCHSDLHTARNEWHGTKYPCVPGHEIVGKVVSVGSQIQSRRHGRRRLHCRLMPRLPVL